MCTGDKFSTALTISKTCNLKLKTDELVELEGVDAAQVCTLWHANWMRAPDPRVVHSLRHCVQVERTLKDAAIQMGLRSPRGAYPRTAFTVIARGDALEVAFQHCPALLSELMLAARAAVCCRCVSACPTPAPPFPSPPPLPLCTRR